MDAETGSITQTHDPTFLERCEQQPKPGDRHCKRINVDTIDTVQCPLHNDSAFGFRIALLPAVDDATKGTQQEVTGTAGRVDHFEAARPLTPNPSPRIGARGANFNGNQTEFINCRIERTIENEFFDKVGRLKQSKLLTSGFGEVLVKVT